MLFRSRLLGVRDGQDLTCCSAYIRQCDGLAHARRANAELTVGKTTPLPAVLARAHDTLARAVTRCRGPRPALANGASGWRHLGTIVVMVPADAGVGGTRATAARLDPESAEWLRLLAGTGSRREAALARLHAMLVRIAQGEVRQRGPRLRVTGPRA